MEGCSSSGCDGRSEARTQGAFVCGAIRARLRTPPRGEQRGRRLSVVSPSPPMRERSLEADDHQPEQHVQRHRDGRFHPAEAFERGIAGALERERRNAEAEREADGGLLPENAESSEDEHGDRSQRRQRNRKLVTGDIGELGDVQPPAALQALREHVRIHVREPEHEHRAARENRKPRGVRVLAARPRGDGRHHDDRPVDRSGDGSAAADQEALEGVADGHVGDVLRLVRGVLPS